MIFYVSLALMAASVLFAVLCLAYVIRTYNSIDGVLDRILSKKISSSIEATADNRNSKLAHKANRIIEVCAADVAQNRNEKETVQKFISDMSHQMKTPLSSISMYSYLLSKGNPSERDEFISRIRSGAEKLEWLMDSLIKMSRLEAGAVQLTPERASIKQTISESISGVIALASTKNISVTDFEDCYLNHDRRWTQEALVNLLENAIKYSPEDGGIEITVERLALFTKLSVTDRGAGIAKDEWSLVFNRFYRGTNAKGVEGAGLGLYLVSLIMEKQGGYVTVDSAAGEYTTFSLFLRT